MDTLQYILQQRLVSHGLSKPFFSSPQECIQHYGCVQSQDIGQAMRVIGSRVAGRTKDTIKQALTKGTIVRTWPMRGTLHYMAPEYVHWMLDLCASKTLTGFAKRREFLGISDAYAEKALSIMQKALKGGKFLTRTQLGEALKTGGIPMQTQRVYHLACYAATRKLICFGPPTQKEETFVLLDEWVKKPTHTLTHDEQLSELARMYIRGHGPCTVDDLARRCGLGKTECKKAIALVADECETIEYQNKIYYYNATQKTKISIKSKQKGTSSSYLLGGFDEYFLGYKDRSIVADIEHHGKLFTTNGIFFPLIIQNGRVVGTRKRARKKNAVEITLTTLPGIILSSKDIAKEAQQYGDFWGVEKINIK